MPPPVPACLPLQILRVQPPWWRCDSTEALLAVARGELLALLQRMQEQQQDAAHLVSAAVTASSQCCLLALSCTICPAG